MVDQIEFHVGYHQDDLLAYCRQNDIAITAYSPVAEGSPSLVGTNDTPAGLHPEIAAAAKAHGVSGAQVSLRFITQHEGGTAIPRVGPSLSDDVQARYMMENLAAADSFNLTEAEMRAIGVLGAPKRTGVDPAAIMCIDEKTGAMFRCHGVAS